MSTVLLSENVSQKVACSDESRLPLDRIIPPHVLGRRRHAISNSSETLFKSVPRMKRRGAISYEKSDTTAEYIRYLGDALCKRGHYQHPHPHHPRLVLPEEPSNKLNLSVSRRTGRRGSIQQITPASSYKATMKGTILHSVNVEMQAIYLKDNLYNTDSWDFDVFAFRRITEGRPLFHLGSHLLQRHKLISIMNLDIMKVMKFLILVEQAYHPDNCYHNCTHATDVTQALHCLLSEPKLYSHLTPAELLASLLAAICHDLDHPGVNQNFLLNTSSHLAFIHGPNSLLERHHCNEAKAILRETGLLDHLDMIERLEIISLMENLILATDVTQHADFMKQLEDRVVSEEGVNFSNREERHFMIMIAIKAADISNPSRTFYLSKCWSDHIMEEFFRQGDSEKSMKLPISFLCDRKTTVIPKSQSAFFEYVALPLFKAWSKIFNSKFSIHLCKNIISNKAYWDKQLSDMETL